MASIEDYQNFGGTLVDYVNASGGAAGLQAAFQEGGVLHGAVKSLDTQDSDSTNNHSYKELNELTASSDNFKKAKDYIKSGGTINTIKSKYKMSKEVELALLK